MESSVLVLLLKVITFSACDRHTAPSMGQVAQIGDAGKVVNDCFEYADVMGDLMG